MRRRRFALSMVVLGSTLLPRRSRAASLRGGEYDYVGGARELERFRASVDAATQDMNALVRAIARRRLMQSQSPSGRLSLVRTDDELSLVMPGKPTLRGPTDGSVFRWKGLHGDPYKVRLQEKSNAVVARFHSKTSRTVMTLKTPSVDSLIIRVAVRDERLSAPFDYRFTYRRR